jgi:hypothetical protein
VAALLVLGTPAWAVPLEDAADPGWEFKFTPSVYLTTNQRTAADVNLRASHGDHTVWLGHYRREGEFEQTRTGYEYAAELAVGRLVSSLQLASHGFAGGSINAELGGKVFGLLGYGRTNARDYYNLNFDPNDSALYGLGLRLPDETTMNAYVIRDNRLHTEQQVGHLVWRHRPDPQHRWTADLFAKRGRATPEDDRVSGTGLSLTYDFDRRFVRAAWDPKVNFSHDDQLRLSFGIRF